jgi:hypothetical protein
LRGTDASGGYDRSVVALYNAENYLMLGIGLALLVVKLFALVDAATRPARAFVSEGKLTKVAWLLILSLTLAVHLLSPPIGLLSLIGTVAALVYLADVRPALKGYRGAR